MYKPRYYMMSIWNFDTQYDGNYGLSWILYGGNCRPIMFATHVSDSMPVSYQT